MIAMMSPPDISGDWIEDLWLLTVLAEVFDCDKIDVLVAGAFNYSGGTSFVPTNPLQAM